MKRMRKRTLDVVQECQEPIKVVKDRAERAKEQLDLLLELVEAGAFDYDIRNEVIGKAYLEHREAKLQLKRRKA